MLILVIFLYYSINIWTLLFYFTVCAQSWYEIHILYYSKLYKIITLSKYAVNSEIENTSIYHIYVHYYSSLFIIGIFIKALNRFGRLLT